MNSFPADTPVHVRVQTDAGYVRTTKPIQDLRIGDEVLAWDELAAHDAQASRQPAQLKQASHTASAINVAAAPAIPSTQRYEKITEIAHSVKEQTLIHIALDNGQHITATAGHPFKTSEGWRDAVLLKKGGKLLLKDSESDAQAAPRYASITAVSTETKTTPVYNLEVANLHTFFVGEAGVGVHNGRGSSPGSNRGAGRQWENDVAGAINSRGTNTATRPVHGISTPFGMRFPDLEVRNAAGTLLAYLECKKGNSPYKPSQRAKDNWIEVTQGVPTLVIRGK